MNTTKMITGGIIGGIANFLLGWLVWGILLMNFMKENSNRIPGVFRDEKDMVWWALILANLGFGFLTSFVLSKANCNSAKSGAVTAAITAFFVSLSFDCMMLAQFNLFNKRGMVVDIAASVVVASIVGAIIGWYNGRGTKSA